MGMRKRFNSNRICSSENYEASQRAHREFINRFHEENLVEIQRVTECISVKQHFYVNCFGKLIEITEVEALRIEQSVKIIRK
nr:MAG TPA: hypothetical protein [Caudoviricetes sp.]